MISHDLTSGVRSPASHCSSVACILALWIFGWFAITPALADGCFVFKWDKKTDINEPTQKAIIVHDAGREDLLLQVKYEGPLEEFGWLIPVPSLPKVEKGSMDAFYELSQLTQMHLGNRQGGTIPMGMADEAGTAPAVKVIETKTVGAYEVAVLSAKDAGSLSRWLQSHDYSIPDGKSGIIDDYIHQGWYFIAAKIQLNKATAFKISSGASPKGSKLSAQTRKSVRKRLASGELHPLLISFDSPKCVFPLKISAVGGKPSEVSLYVLSAQPLLNKFIFDEGFAKLELRRAEWDKSRMQREKSRQQCLQNVRTMRLAFLMNPPVSDHGAMVSRGGKRYWSLEDLNAMARAGDPPMPMNSLDDDFYVSPEETLQCLYVGPEQIPQASKSLPRLKGKSWFLTKQVRTFAPAEMQDLGFEPAIPALAKLLPRPTGQAAADVLSQLGPDAVSVLMASCKSKSSVERLNAASGFERLQDRRAVEPLSNLLRDETPQVRLHATRAAAANWDRRFVDPLVALFRDPNHEIRSEAVGCLSMHEGRDQTTAYLTLLRNSDPNARLCALGVLLKINPDAIPPEPLVKLVKDSDPDVQNAALRVLSQMNRDVVRRADLLPLLGGSRTDIATIALTLIEGTGQAGFSMPAPSRPDSFVSAREQQQLERRLTSMEAALLITNRLATARLVGLNVLERNADTHAVELALPLLRDGNPIVRGRAFIVLKSVTGQTLSETDSKPWEEWWTANKASFISRRSAGHS